MNELRISHLLPYDSTEKSKGHLRTALIEFKALLSASLEATEVWKQSDLTKFDSLVGENACEIRALQVCLLAKNGQGCALQEEIDRSISIAQQILDSKQIDTYMRSGISMAELLEQKKLDVSLSRQAGFIIVSYLLTLMKKVQSEGSLLSSIFRLERGDPLRFLDFGATSNSFTQSLLFKLRRWLAARSVEFIRDCACELNDPLLIKMNSEEFTVSTNTLQSTSMFWTYKTMLQIALRYKIPLLIHTKFCKKTEEGYRVAEEAWRIFKVTADDRYYGQDPSPSDFEHPTIVVQGLTVEDEAGNLPSWEEWCSVVQKTTITDVILAGAADHRQYPDQTQDKILLQQPYEEYLRYKFLAETRGFSASNPTCFFIQHVYAAKPSQVIPEFLGMGSGR